jgi:hypothetical protein
MSHSFKIIDNFLDDATVKYIYYNLKDSDSIIHTIAFLKTKELETIEKIKLVPYQCKIIDNIDYIETTEYTLYIQIYESYKTDFKIDHYNISLNPGDAILLKPHVKHERKVTDGKIILLEIKYILPMEIYTKTEASYLQNNFISFWKTDTWTLLTPNKTKKLDTPIIYNISNFPAFLNLDIDTFIIEAKKVYDSININNTIFRDRSEWDNPNTIQNLKDIIKEDNNSSWIVTHYNKNWLNYPLMYYDEALGGKAEELCPTILSFLKKIKHIRIAGLSLLKKGGVIKPHCDSTGITNDSLACHICLTGTGILTIKDTTIRQEPYKVFIFDSEHEHSACNSSEEDRIILYIDFVYSKHYKPKKQIKINIYSCNEKVSA